MNEEKPKYCAVDTETFYSDSCSVIPLGTVAYTLHPEFNAYLVSIWSEEYQFVGSPRDADWGKIAGHVWLSHNAGFDIAVYEWIKKQIPNLPTPKAWHCTSSLACYLGAPRNLGGAAKYLLGEEPSKDMRKWMKGKTWQDCVDAGKAEDMKAYALADVRLCYNIGYNFMDQWPEHEKQLSALTYTKGAEGIHVDSDTLQKGITLLEKVIWETENELPWILNKERNPKTKELYTPTSTLALKDACAKAEIPPPVSTAEDSPECQRWEDEYAERYPWVAAMRKWRKANKIHKLLEKLQKRTLPNETITYSLKYFGAHTGRWSGDAGFNIQNLHKGDILGVDIRKILRARKGKKFVICDLAQIEPRVLAHAVGDFETLDAVRKGFPIYEAHARATMGWTGGKLKAENPDRYALAKARVLGLGYGCGAKKFVVVAKNLAGLELSEEEAEQTVRQFRTSNPRITNFWGELEYAFKRAAINRSGEDNTFSLILPSGRTMRYWNVQAKHGLQAQTTRGDVHKFIWGGTICENYVQAVARDVFAYGLLELERNGVNCLWGCHDEFICEVDPSFNKEEVVKIVTQCPPWLEGCPIGAEAFDADCYTK